MRLKVKRDLFIYYESLWHNATSVKRGQFPATIVLIYQPRLFVLCSSVSWTLAKT